MKYSLIFDDILDMLDISPKNIFIKEDNITCLHYIYIRLKVAMSKLGEDNPLEYVSYLLSKHEVMLLHSETFLDFKQRFLKLKENLEETEEETIDRIFTILSKSAATTADTIKAADFKDETDVSFNAIAALLSFTTITLVSAYKLLPKDFQDKLDNILLYSGGKRTERVLRYLGLSTKKCEEGFGIMNGDNTVIYKNGICHSYEIILHFVFKFLYANKYKVTSSLDLLVLDKLSEKLLDNDTDTHTSVYAYNVLDNGLELVLDDIKNNRTCFLNKPLHMNIEGNDVIFRETLINRDLLFEAFVSSNSFCYHMILKLIDRDNSTDINDEYDADKITNNTNNIVIDLLTWELLDAPAVEFTYGGKIDESFKNVFTKYRDTVCNTEYEQVSDETTSNSDEEIETKLLSKTSKISYDKDEEGSYVKTVTIMPFIRKQDPDFIPAESRVLLAKKYGLLLTQGNTLVDQHTRSYKGTEKLEPLDSSKKLMRKYDIINSNTPCYNIFEFNEQDEIFSKVINDGNIDGFDSNTTEISSKVKGLGLF